MSDTPKTVTSVLAIALDVLAREIESGDGVANAAIAEAAERLRELEREIYALREDNARLEFLFECDVRIPSQNMESGWYHFNCRSDVDAARREAKP